MIKKYSKLQFISFQFISLQSLQNGLYLLVIESKDGVTTKPIIISK